jgi:hypothetical protein
VGGAISVHITTASPGILHALAKPEGLTEQFHNMSMVGQAIQQSSGQAFVGLADLQNPSHKWHGFRIFAHNP